MSTLPTLPNNGTSFNTKQILFMLNKNFLSPNQQDKIEQANISWYTVKDFPLAKAAEAIKDSDSLIRMIASATDFNNKITQAPKAKEYKLYRENLEAGIKEATNQLDRLKKHAKIIDSSLHEWHSKAQEITEKAIRPGVGFANPTMIKLVKEANILVDALIGEAKKLNQQRITSEESLRKSIESAKMVVPEEVLRAVSLKKPTIASEEPYTLPGISREKE